MCPQLVCALVQGVSVSSRMALCSLSLSDVLSGFDARVCQIFWRITQLVIDVLKVFWVLKHCYASNSINLNQSINQTHIFFKFGYTQIVLKKKQYPLTCLTILSPVYVIVCSTAKIFAQISKPFTLALLLTISADCCKHGHL